MIPLKMGRMALMHFAPQAIEPARLCSSRLVALDLVTQLATLPLISHSLSTGMCIYIEVLSNTVPKKVIWVAGYTTLL